MNTACFLVPPLLDHRVSRKPVLLMLLGLLSPENTCGLDWIEPSDSTVEELADSFPNLTTFIEESLRTHPSVSEIERLDDQQSSNMPLDVVSRLKDWSKRLSLNLD